MFNATKNRRRFSAGSTQRSSVQISGSRSVSLESRQLLTAVTVAPQESVEVAEADAAHSDIVFAEMADPSMTASGDGTATAFVSHDAMAGNAAANLNAIPEPPTVPDGLGNDIQQAESDAVDRAHELHESITQLHTDKAECLKKVAEL